VRAPKVYLRSINPAADGILMRAEARASKRFEQSPQADKKGELDVREQLRQISSQLDYEDSALTPQRVSER
jgi:hypothetical protein